MLDAWGLFLRDRFLRNLFYSPRSENAGGGEIERGLSSRPALRVSRRNVFSPTFVKLRRTPRPQALLLAHQPHRRPVALQAFSRTKLIQAAARAARSLRGLRRATMWANVIRFRLCLCRLSLFHPVVIFLNGEGGAQQALKGLLLQRQVGPVEEHTSPEYSLG